AEWQSLLQQTRPLAHTTRRSQPQNPPPHIPRRPTTGLLLSKEPVTRMSHSNKAATIGQLRDSGYRVLSVKDEMRQNLMRKKRAGEEIFPGIVGYEETVIPQIENAILSG